MLNEYNKEEDGRGAFAAEVHFFHDQTVIKYLQRNFCLNIPVYCLCPSECIWPAK